MKEFITCGSTNVNTGISPCRIDPAYIDVIILTDYMTQIPIENFEEELEKLIHADRPNRVYPIPDVAEYAPSGNEGQTSAVGYGPSEFSGYSALSETWSLSFRDEGLYINLQQLKSSRMRAIFVDRDNRVYAIKGDEGKIMGYELSNIFPQGQRFKSSGSNPTLDVILNYKNYSREAEKAIVKQAETDIAEKAVGLIWVELVKKDAGYKLRTKVEQLDVTNRYGKLLEATEAWNNVTAVTYDADTDYLVLTAEADKTPSLKSPSKLYELGIKNIEEWKE